MAVLMPMISPCVVDQRATAVARVDRGVGLDQVDRSFAATGELVADGDRAIERRHDAARDGLRELAQRAADCQHRLADLDLRRIAQRGRESASPPEALMTARSWSGSAEMTVASSSWPSAVVTVSVLAFSMTWLLVRIRPFELTMTPEPTPVDGTSNGENMSRLSP